MDIKDLIKKRGSVRKYLPASIGVENLVETLALARKAPSAGGLRAYFIYPTNKTSEVAKIAHQAWIAQASFVFVICVNPEKSAKKYGDRGRKLYCIQDATLYGAYLDLLLIDRGHGTCWVGAFDEQKMKKLLNIANELRPISLLVVGKAGEKYE